MEAGLIFQKCQECQFSNYDDPKPLYLAMEGQDNSLHGQVRTHFLAGEFIAVFLTAFFSAGIVSSSRIN